jgi:hypothetical protein
MSGDKIDFTDSIRGVDDERAQWESDMINEFLDSVEKDTEDK